MIKSDKWIRRMAAQQRMIEPFEPGQVREVNGRKIVSYGTSSYGYDIRCSNEFKLFTNHQHHHRRPEELRRRSRSSTSRAIPASSRRTRLRWRARSNISAFRATCSPSALGKCTYARCGIIVNVTPLEPEWEGYVTLEFSNTTPLPAKIYANEGVAQVIFFESDEVCETSYKDRGGKYQGQKGVTLPKI